MQQVVPCVLHSTTDQIKQVICYSCSLLQAVFIYRFKLINRLLLMNIRLVKIFGFFLQLYPLTGMLFKRAAILDDQNHSLPQCGPV